MLSPRIFQMDPIDSFFADLFPRTATLRATMRTDVKDVEGAYEYAIELPGYSKDDVSLTLKDGSLIVKAEKNVEKDEKGSDGKFIRRERSFGSCTRTFYVGEDIEEGDVKAKFKDGVLTISVPKKEVEKVEDKKTIPIE